MYDADTLEAINFEQLATPTDRLLLRGQLSKRRPSVPSLVHHARLARGTQPNLVAVQPPALPVQPNLESTVVVRRARTPHAQVFAFTIVIPILVGVVVGLAAVL